MSKRISYIFKSELELIKYIKNEVKKYVGKYDNDSIINSYYRLTLNEITNEVYIKLLRSGKELEEMNKTFVRNAVVMVCIDLYRKPCEYYSVEDLETSSDKETDLETNYENNSVIPVSEEEIYDEILFNSQLEIFDDKERIVLLKLREGLKHSEVFESIGMAKTQYYALLSRIKDKINLNFPEQFKV